MGEDVLNNELLKDINIKIIMNNSLSDIIKNNSGIKLEGLYKYNKVVIDNVNYEIEVLVSDNKVTGINVNSENISYEIKYEA